MSNQGKIAILAPQTTLSKEYEKLLGSYQIETIEIDDRDFMNPALLASKIDGCHAVCNFSSVPYLTRWTTESQFEIFSSRHLALRTFDAIFSLCKDKPKIFICISNAMQYDQYEVHDDYSTVLGNSFFAELGKMETKLSLELARNHPEIRLVIARLGFTFNHKTGAFPILRRLSKFRLGGVIGDGYQCLPVIHIDDATRAIFRLTTDDNCTGIYNITIPEITSLSEIVGALGKTQFSLPRPIINFLAGRASAIIEQNCKVVPNRLLREHFTFKYPNIRSIIEALSK